jgi:hypothetical protein
MLHDIALLQRSLDDATDGNQSDTTTHTSVQNERGV